MNRTAQLEEAVLRLPASDRVHLALAAWESLESDPAFAASAEFDPEGIALAAQRDSEIEAGSSKPISHEEFLERTGGAKK